MDEYETDREEIDRVTRALYSSICLEEGGKPALDRLRNLCIPEGRLINNNDDTPVPNIARFPGNICNHETERKLNENNAFPVDDFMIEYTI